MKIVTLMSVHGERAVGGAERTAFELAKGLVQRGHDVHLWSLSPKGEKPPSPRMEQGVHCDFVPLKQLYDPFNLIQPHPAKGFFKRAARVMAPLSKLLWHVLDIYNVAMAIQLRRKLALIRPDVLFTHTLQGFSVAVWAVAKSLGIKVVHMTHDHALICPRTAMTRGAKVCESVCASCQVFSTVRRGLSVMPDAVVGPSEVVLRRHHQYGWFRQVAVQRVVPNALPANWAPLTASPPPCQADFTRQRPIVFGFLGRLDESKGADTVVRALCLLPDEHLGRWRMVFAGQGAVSQLRAWVSNQQGGGAQWAKISPFVHHLGLVNANDHLRTIDVLLAPSRAHETFCNVVLEAASLARPSIVSNKGALPERIAHGDAGWMVEAADEKALSQQMCQLMCDSEAVNQKAIQAWQISQRYTAKHQVDLMEAVLKDIVHG